MEDRTPFPARRAVHPLSGGPGTVAAARGHAQEFFARCLPALTPAAMDDALLLVSELVTNAVRHAPGPCALLLTDDRQRLTVTVSDTSDAVPVGRPGDLEAGTGGFGWQLLHRLAQRVAVQVHEGGGKSVTAVLIPDTVRTDGTVRTIRTDRSANS
ncbi:ATP-binding protein [Streptacidiphilus sp. P02-A3a]|uniref:ATP-binding protein n=1 Tax=Streptacidiphilus sp. P02-A3a TaxID=2704468 RepID=UPI0015F8B320|nr:ATP-binding protein [Streptacidiphilus sp. P02-A3a]QMU70556.1 ATP-binding protein [Streptacidiphilus sp. P02-A3a]